MSYTGIVESYESFDVVFRTDDSGRISVRRDRAGCEPQPFSPPESLEGLTPREIGSALFRALFQGSLARELERALGRLRREESRGLRLRLVLDPTDSRLAAIAALPWELLYDPDDHRFFGQDPRTPVVRFLSLRSAGAPTPTDPPLSILLAYAEPRGLDGLQLEQEADRLYEAAARADVDLKLVRARNPVELGEALARGRYEILHFMGHGMLKRNTGEGVLLFENPRGGPREVTGQQLAYALRGIPTLRLVILNACETAGEIVSPGSDPYAGVASALVQADVPAVVAMRSGITDVAALSFSETLYRHLAERRPIEEAVARARVRLAQERPDSLDWATPALFLQSMDGDLFDLSGKRHCETPWWRSWTTRSLAAGLLLLALFWLMLPEVRRSPASVSAYMTNPPECQPMSPELNLHFVRIDPGSSELGTGRKDDLPELGMSFAEPFCLGRFEVTRWQWWYVMERAHEVPEPTPEERYLPASGITYEEAVMFTHRLNELVQQDVYRLPLETEWEFAATQGFSSEMDENLERYANCGGWLGDGLDSMAPVGSKAPDRLDLYDMLGNVYEWVIAADVDLEPGQVVRRGGSYNSATYSCSVNHRKDVLPTSKMPDSGLRLVRELTPEPDS